MRFFNGRDGITKTIKIENPSYAGYGSTQTIAEIHNDHILFILQKGDDYLGFGCTKFAYFKKKQDD